MEVFRITQEQYCEDLSGNGAKIYGGRWNSAGLATLYAASSRSLALLETLAHTPAQMLQVKPYVLSIIDLPDSESNTMISYHELPAGWADTGTNAFTIRSGDEFIKSNKGLWLSVPSVLMPEENIFVINPLHIKMKNVKITGKRLIWFDKRVEQHVL